MKLRKVFKFLAENYFIFIFFAIVIFVAFVSAYKIFFTKPSYIYVKVKLGQGLWWATTAKPSIWLAQSIKKGEKEYDLTGKPTAEILTVSYYPARQENQYDVYVEMKLAVSGSKKTNKYSFKRSAIGIGSPVDFEFPSSQFSATIIDLNNKPFNDKYIEKTIYLTKKLAYPWEFDSIIVGDKYFDGRDFVFEILDKKATDTSIISSDPFGNTNVSTVDIRKYIVVKAKIRVKEIKNQFILGEEQIVSVGKRLTIATSSFNFEDFYVSKIE